MAIEKKKKGLISIIIFILACVAWLVYTQMPGWRQLILGIGLGIAIGTAVCAIEKQKS